jgi:hypothetical protein
LEVIWTKILRAVVPCYSQSPTPSRFTPLYGFLSGFPLLESFLIVVFMGKIYIYIKIKCNKRKTMIIFKGKQRDNVNKSKSKKNIEGSKSAGRGDCE